MLLPEYDLTGKTALITGASRGIGKGIAKVLASVGADIAINALTSTHMETVAEEIRQIGRKVVTIQADVTDSRAVDQMMRKALDELGHIDILVNNVGESAFKPLVPPPGQGPDAGVTDEMIRYQLDINLINALLCCRALGPHMIERCHGKVINISSLYALKARTESTAYSAAKAGLIQFTKALAVEWAPYNINVNCIAPGIFLDPDTVGEEAMLRGQKIARDRTVLKRAGELREVGLLAVYLASAASDYLTGQTIFLDGGATL